LKKLIFCTLVILCTLFCGCSSQNLESLTLGKYQLENASGVTAPYVLLEGNKFIFQYSVASSYFNRGTYKIEDNTLILTTEDEAYTYVFQIDNEKLCFNLKSSSKLTEYKGETPIEDGAKFILIKDE
jgi:hypothetical protein